METSAFSGRAPRSLSLLLHFVGAALGFPGSLLRGFGGGAAGFFAGVFGVLSSLLGVLLGSSLGPGAGSQKDESETALLKSQIDRSRGSRWQASGRSFSIGRSENKRPPGAPTLGTPGSPVDRVLFGQRFFAGVFGEAAGVLQAGLLVVTGDGFESRFGDGLFNHVFTGDLDLAVILHAGASGDEAAHDHVLLQAAELIYLAIDGGFGEHARSLLEGCGGDERIGRKRSLGDA